MSSSILKSRRLRWAVPIAVGGAVAGAALIPTGASADEHPTLPARSAAQLLVDLHASSVQALSGTVVETARLGLPDLPTSSTGGAASPIGLLTGSHSVRVWDDGVSRQRIAVLGQLSEYDAVHNGTDLWTYTSDGNTATHTTLPAESADSHSAVGGGSGTAGDPSTYATPQAAAEALLADVDPTTAVTVDRTAKVAGRSAYQLVLTPRDTSSLVGSIRIALDSATKAPLRVQVFSSDSTSTPALEVGFTDVSFTAPAASVFAFSAPPGATVTEEALPTDKPSAADQAKARDARQQAQPKVLGKGWTSVVELSTGGLSAKGGKAAKGSSSLTSELNALTTPVAQGRLLTTSLLSILLTNDGRVLVGAVTPQVIEGLAS